MTAYRDRSDRCPRCATELIDARAARGCPTCRGLWVALPDLLEMTYAMTPSPYKLELPFVHSPHQPLACPACTEVMGTWSLFGVQVDRCDNHGVWFDPDELGQILLAVWVRGDAR